MNDSRPVRQSTGSEKKVTPLIKAARALDPRGFRTRSESRTASTFGPISLQAAIARRTVSRTVAPRRVVGPSGDFKTPGRPTGRRDRHDSQSDPVRQGRRDSVGGIGTREYGNGWVFFFLSENTRCNDRCFTFRVRKGRVSVPWGLFFGRHDGDRYLNSYTFIL